MTIYEWDQENFSVQNTMVVGQGIIFQTQGLPRHGIQTEYGRNGVPVPGGQSNRLGSDPAVLRSSGLQFRVDAFKDLAFGCFLSSSQSVLLVTWSLLSVHSKSKIE